MTAESTIEGSSGGETTQVNNSLNPLHFPPKNVDCDEDSQQQISFEQACQLAADSHRPLHLSQDVDLTETIVLRKRQRLVIVGISKHDLSLSSSSKASNHKIKIAGNVHSLFLGNNHSQLELSDLELIHQEPDGEDCTMVGAAVNLRYKASANLNGCDIISHAGFCCWAVQKGSLYLGNCNLEAPLRSAVVCFGKANFEGRTVTIRNVGVHAVCARGECTIVLKQSQLMDAAVRGLYAYANASVCLEECTVSGTVRPDAAAIEVLSAAIENEPQSGSKPNKKGTEERKASSLMMKRCQILNNKGVGVRIRGPVKHNLHSETTNKFEGNAGGDEVDFLSAQEEESNEGDETSHTNNQQTEQLRRDDAGSSFRKGDWWCLHCTPKSIVHNSKDSCPCCGSVKQNGKPLSSEEVITLNRGESIATTNTTATWWFDGDDAGWLLYDAQSTEALENAFQSLKLSEANHDEQLSSKTVFLSNGKYSVNLETMEQINTESHMLRLVQRRIS